MTDNDKTTRFYDLPLFYDGDPANLRDKWNEAMNIIDQRMHIIETKIDTKQGTYHD